MEDSIAKEIETNFPSLKVSSVVLAGEGMDSKAFLVNDHLIFRFPKVADVAEHLKVEIELLPHLQKVVSLNIPRFEYVGTQSNGFPFVGYEKINGDGLTTEVLDGLATPVRKAAFEALSRFLQEIHAFPIDITKRCGIKITAFRDDFRSDFETLKRDGFPLLDEDARTYAENLYTDYLTVDENFTFHPVLLHADFSPEHILYDAKQNAIAGVIDFGDASTGDPDYDLMYLYEIWGEATLTEFLNYYPHNDHALLFRKLNFFSRANTFQDVLNGLKRKDDGILKYALDKVKREVVAEQ